MALSSLFTFGGAMLLFLLGLGVLASGIYAPLASAGSAALFGITYLTLSVAHELRKQR